VHDLKRVGVDFIKVRDHAPRDVFFAIAAEGPKVGLTFAGHVPSTVAVEEVADAGIRSIEHLSNYTCLVSARPAKSIRLRDAGACSANLPRKVR
jgi:hypothetical protein